jgi:hypothetical protein
MKHDDHRPLDGRPEQGAPRRQYHRPVLEVYGDLTEITQSMMTMMMMMNDGASHANKHFTS